MHLIHPKPQGGEAVTSWLIRTAEARGVLLHVLTQQLAGEAEFWTRDGDLLAPPLLLRALAETNGTSLADAEATALRSYEGVLEETLSGSNQSPMVRQLGVFHRVRRAYGQQICPLCLGEEIPFNRMTWRLRLVTCCLRHGVVLIDACPDCQSPIIPHRGGLTACHACGFDVIRAPIEAADSCVLQLQYESEQVLNGRAVMWPGLQGMFPISFFRLQLRLLCAIQSRKWGSRLRSGLAEHLSALEPELVEAPISNHQPTTSVTHQAMRGVELLLRGWPVMLAGICRDAQVWASWILPEERKSLAPFALRDALDTYLRPGSAPPRVQATPRSVHGRVQAAPLQDCVHAVAPRNG